MQILPWNSFSYLIRKDPAYRSWPVENALLMRLITADNTTGRFPVLVHNIQVLMLSHTEADHITA